MVTLRPTWATWNSVSKQQLTTRSRNFQPNAHSTILWNRIFDQAFSLSCCVLPTFLQSHLPGTFSLLVIFWGFCPKSCSSGLSSFFLRLSAGLIILHSPRMVVVELVLALRFPPCLGMWCLTSSRFYEGQAVPSPGGGMHSWAVVLKDFFFPPGQGGLTL